MCLSAFEQMSICDVPTTHAEAVDCNHRLIVWSLLGVMEWDAFQVVKARWDDRELNHLILNTLTLSINKIDATGAITVSAFDAMLVHYKQYTLPAWSTKSGTPNFSAYACYVVCPTYHHNIVKFMFIIAIQLVLYCNGAWNTLSNANPISQQKEGSSITQESLRQSYTIFNDLARHPEALRYLAPPTFSVESVH
jgi:hypothetical protein